MKYAFYEKKKNEICFLFEFSWSEIEFEFSWSEIDHLLSAIFHNVFACNNIDLPLFCYPFFTFISWLSSSLIRNSVNEVFFPVSRDGSSYLAEFNPLWFIGDSLVLPSLLLPSFLNILVEAQILLLPWSFGSREVKVLFEILNPNMISSAAICQH